MKSTYRKHFPRNLSDQIAESLEFLTRVLEEPEEIVLTDKLERNGWNLELCEERERLKINPTLL